VPGFYHCVSRCVRRAFLCGQDACTGQDFEHRKEWVEQRLLELARWFDAGVYAYAVMSNQVHVLVHFDPGVAAGWSPEGVARRWVGEFPNQFDDVIDQPARGKDWVYQSGFRTTRQDCRAWTSPSWSKAITSGFRCFGSMPSLPPVLLLNSPPPRLTGATAAPRICPDNLAALGAAMKTVIVLFNLKPGASRDDYERWARENDLPTVNALGSVDRFEVLKSAGLLIGEGKPPYEYIELIRINDMDAFGRDVASPAVQQGAAQFQQFADNPLFILTDAL
jgi:hypothetical protein